LHFRGFMHNSKRFFEKGVILRSKPLRPRHKSTKFKNNDKLSNSQILLSIPNFRKYKLTKIRVCPKQTSAIRERLYSVDIFRTREEVVLQMRTSALFGAKRLRIFRNLWRVRTDRGLSQCGHFSDKYREEVNFTRFLRRFFMDGT